MIRSVRFLFRDGQHLDLSAEEVAQNDCRIDIEADASGNYQVAIHRALKRGCEPRHAQGEIDDVVNRPAAAEEVGKDDRRVVGVGYQSGADFTRWFAQQRSSHHDLGNIAQQPGIMAAQSPGVEP